MTIGKCKKCGTFRKSLHRDHIKPKMLVGSDKPSNIQYLCANCHEDKSVAQLSKIMKANWANPAKRRTMMANRATALAKPGAKEKWQAAMKAGWAKPGVKEKFRTVRKAAWAKIGPKERSIRLKKVRAIHKARRNSGDDVE